MTCMLKLKRVCFMPTPSPSLGFIVALGRVQVDPAKVSAVADWPTPDSRKKVQQFLGFANFYRRFLRGFSAIAAPLHALTSTQVRFHWSPEAEKAFQMLKHHFTSAPILTMPDPQRQFIEVDASNEGVGAVLSQCSEQDGKMHPYAFLAGVPQCQTRRPVTTIRPQASWDHPTTKLCGRSGNLANRNRGKAS